MLRGSRRSSNICRSTWPPRIGLHEPKALLCDYDWLSAKLRATNVAAILADSDLVVQNADLTLVQQALRLSIPALLRDRSQLPGQWLGRLREADDPTIRAWVAGAGQGPGRAWLRPQFASLTPPGGPLRQILDGHTGPVNVVAFLADRSRRNFFARPGLPAG